MAELAVIGLGRLGSCLAASLACAGHRVYGVDSDVYAVEAVRENRPSIEPGLNETIALAGDRLTVSTDLNFSVAATDATFVVVPTPSLDNGSFDPAAVYEVAHQVRDAAGTDRHTLVVCSTVSPGSMRHLTNLETDTFHVAYSPLFIALGQILADMAAPDFRLIGATNPQTAELVADIWETLGEAPVAAVGVAEAEVIKLAVNAFLVTKSAYGDAIAQACMASGVDGRQVLATVGCDRRIGGAFLHPGAIPSGPCLPRDHLAMAHWLGRNRVPDGLMHEVHGLRSWQVARVAGMLRPYRTVAVLGLTYKAGTTVTEGSLGSKIADRLERDGQAVICSDPNLPGPTAEEAITDADAVLVATAHPHYAGLDTQGKPTVDMWDCVQPGPNVTVWGVGQTAG